MESNCFYTSRRHYQKEDDAGRDVKQDAEEPKKKEMQRRWRVNGVKSTKAGGKREEEDLVCVGYKFYCFYSLRSLSTL